MKCRVKYLLRFYLLTVLLFIVAKIVFMLAYRGEQAFTPADMVNVVSHGLSLDLSTALYFLIVPFLLTVVSLWLRVPRWLYNVYYVLIAVAFAAAFVADTSLYAFWHFKLDASCLQYLETPTEAMASVSVGYLTVRLLALITAAVAIYWAYKSHKPDKSHKPQKPFPEILLYLLLIPGIGIGIRGGVDESTTNIGQVYYSQNQFLNHSAVNPVFSF